MVKGLKLFNFIYLYKNESVIDNGKSILILDFCYIIRFCLVILVMFIFDYDDFWSSIILIYVWYVKVIINFIGVVNIFFVVKFI